MSKRGNPGDLGRSRVVQMVWNTSLKYPRPSQVTDPITVRYHVWEAAYVEPVSKVTGSIRKQSKVTQRPARMVPVREQRGAEKDAMC